MTCSARKALPTSATYRRREASPFRRWPARGEIDFGISFAGSVVFHLDAGVPVTALAGVHSGCYELFAHEPIRAISDLKGKSVGIQTLSSSGHLYVAIMAAHVGLDPRQDINWVTPPTGNAMELFADGKVDAFLGFPPEPQELRARNIGRVILNTAMDQPWSQYLCCMLFGSRDFVRNYPVATKRSLRAILKAADFCAAEPERAASVWSMPGSTALRLRAPDADRASVRPMARVRPGGHDAVLRAPPP